MYCQAGFTIIIAMQVWVLVLQADHGTQALTVVFFFLSHSSSVVHLHGAECKTGAQIYPPSALGHACQLK